MALTLVNTKQWRRCYRLRFAGKRPPAAMESSHTTQGAARSARAAAAVKKANAGFDMQLLAQQAAEAARMLKLIGNERRLLILCFLVANGEMRAGDLTGVAGLSQSALSQHWRRCARTDWSRSAEQSQTLHYRISDPRAALILNALKDIYCGDIPQTAKRRRG